MLVVFPKVFILVAKKSFTFASRPKSQLEKTFWTSKQENMFYCLVFFLKHLYNTYTIVQNVDRYYIGVPYLEGIMDSACRQGSLSLRFAADTTWQAKKIPPNKQPPAFVFGLMMISGIPKTRPFAQVSMGNFLSLNHKRFFCALIPKQPIYSKDRPIKTCIYHVCTRQITIHFPFWAWQKHNLQNNRSELLMVI